MRDVRQEWCTSRLTGMKWKAIACGAVFLCLAWIDFLLILANELTMTHYEKALGGRPLPWITSVVQAPTSPLYWFPVFSVAVLIYVFRSRHNAPQWTSALLLSVVLSLACILTIVFGTVMPAIPYGPGMLKR
jgi:hypothetical protein